MNAKQHNYLRIKINKNRLMKSHQIYNLILLRPSIKFRLWKLKVKSLHQIRKKTSKQTLSLKGIDCLA